MNVFKKTKFLLLLLLFICINNAYALAPAHNIISIAKLQRPYIELLKTQSKLVFMSEIATHSKLFSEEHKIELLRNHSAKYMDKSFFQAVRILKVDFENEKKCKGINFII